MSTPIVFVETSGAKRVKADSNIDSQSNDAYIVDDLLLTGPEPVAVWKHDTSPVLVAESVHYNGLLERANAFTPNDRNSQESVPFLSGDYAILANIWSTNFYHWFEELLRATILERLGFDGKYVIREGDAFILETFASIGISLERVVYYKGTSLRLERAWFTSRVPMFSWSERPTLFFDLRARFLDRSKADSAKNILLVRGERARNPRDIVNRDEVYELTKQFDYQVLDPAILTIQEQIGIFSSAQSLMGMHGAAFCHCMFMRRKSSVIEFFSPLYINYTIISIIKLLKHKYYPLVSQMNVSYEHGQDALVDVRLLRVVLEENLAI